MERNMLVYISQRVSALHLVASNIQIRKIFVNPENDSFNSLIILNILGWCPPCRMFTPLLKQFYDKYGAEKGLELVFVSSDKEEGSFKEYFSHMSWYALPFADRDRKNKVNIVQM
jgi:thiol-disulfide isomerase/thioredoxin